MSSRHSSSERQRKRSKVQSAWQAHRDPARRREWLASTDLNLDHVVSEQDGPMRFKLRHAFIGTLGIAMRAASGWWTLSLRSFESDRCPESQIDGLGSRQAAFAAFELACRQQAGGK